MTHAPLLEPTSMGSLQLANRLVMAPMTRCRTERANAPNDLMAEYYTQRASAGPIVTEGTSPSPNGTGYARIPGIWNDAQVAGWRRVTDAVHARGGRIAIQLMHTGRVGHPANLPPGAQGVHRLPLGGVAGHGSRRGRGGRAAGPPLLRRAARAHGQR